MVDQGVSGEVKSQGKKNLLPLMPFSMEFVENRLKNILPSLRSFNLHQKPEDGFIPSYKASASISPSI
jgi:hypothetical protein